MPQQAADPLAGYRVNGPSDPFSEWRVKAGAPAPSSEVSPPSPGAGPYGTHVWDTLKSLADWIGANAPDVAIGAGKSAARTALDAGQLVNAIPGVGAATNAIGNAIGGAAGQAIYGTKAPPVENAPAFDAARAQTTATNTPQMIGKGIETAAELAIPITKAAEAIPTAAKAGAKFQEVMGAARSIPVDVNASGDVALRIQELADRGGTMPTAVRKFLGRITDPSKAPMDYEEARDFASNISRLSANEFSRLTPVVAREVSELRVTLNKSIASAAKQAGKGEEYAQAMQEYARAMKLRDAVSAVASGAMRTLPYAGGAGAGYWMTKKISSLLGGD